MVGEKTIFMAAFAVFVVLGPSSSALAECGACKPIWARSKPHANVGTIGHIDHNKTTAGTRVRLPGFGKFTTRDPKPRRNAPRTYPMRMKTMQISTLDGKALSNDGRTRVEFTNDKMNSKPAAAAKRRYDLTPEEYRSIWGLNAD